MTPEQCSTRTGKRNHFRIPTSPFTLCGRTAIDKIHDRLHETDAVCYRCFTKKERIEQ